jgi:hypothetical protein
MFADGKTGVEILDGMGIDMSKAVKKRVQAFDDQVARYPGIRGIQYRGSQDTDWSAILDSAAELKDDDVKAKPGASLAVKGPRFGEDERPARTSGLTGLIKDRVDGAKDKAREVDER